MAKNLKDHSDYVRKFIRGSGAERRDMIRRGLHYAQRLGIAQTFDVFNLNLSEKIEEQAKNNLAILHTITRLYQAHQQKIDDVKDIFGTAKFKNVEFTFKGDKIKIGGVKGIDFTDIKVQEGYTKAKYDKLNELRSKQRAKETGGGGGIDDTEEGEEEDEDEDFEDGGDGMSEEEHEMVKLVDELERAADDVRKWAEEFKNVYSHEYESEQADGKVVYDQSDTDPTNYIHDINSRLLNIPGYDELQGLEDYLWGAGDDINNHMTGFTPSGNHFFTDTGEWDDYKRAVDSTYKKVADRLDRTAQRLKQGKLYKSGKAGYEARKQFRQDKIKTKYRQKRAMGALERLERQLTMEGYSKEEITEFLIRRIQDRYKD